jgi:hypothetical protein
MKYLVYPKGYDPIIASQECNRFYRSIGCAWTADETKRMKEMETQIKVQDEKPEFGLWYEEKK